MSEVSLIPWQTIIIIAANKLLYKIQGIRTSNNLTLFGIDKYNPVIYIT